MAQSSKTIKKIAAIASVAIGIMVLFACFFGRFLPFGVLRDICNFFVGSLGMAFFGILLAVILIAILRLVGKDIVLPGKYIINFISMYLVVVLLVHMYSTNFLLETASSFGAYVAIVYNYYVLPTFGGVVFGSIVYMLQSILTIWGASILLLALLAVNIYFTVCFMYDRINNPELFTKPEPKVRNRSTENIDVSNAFESNAGTTENNNISDNVLKTAMGFGTNGTFYANSQYDTEDSSTTMTTASEDFFNKPMFKSEVQDYADNYAQDTAEEESVKQLSDIIVDYNGYAEENQTHNDDESIFTKNLFPTNNSNSEISTYDKATVDKFVAKEPGVEETTYKNNSDNAYTNNFATEIDNQPETNNVVDDTDLYSDYDGNEWQDDSVESQLEELSNIVNESFEENLCEDAPLEVVDDYDNHFEQQNEPIINIAKAESNVAANADKKPEKVVTAEKEPAYTPYVYNAPPLSLLVDPEIAEDVEQGEFDRRAQAIASKFISFRKKVVAVEPVIGPTIVQYRFEVQDQSIQLSQFANLSTDIQGVLESKESIRVLTPVPGTNLVGVEAARMDRQTVMLKSLLESEESTSAKGEMLMALGQSISGEACFADITRMPHMLISGGSGSGKSVMINSIIISLLYRYSPAELRLVIIDPKREFAIFHGLPHLLTARPIVNTPEVITSLEFLIKEMEARYEMFEKYRSRNLVDYNRAVEQRGGQKLPYILFIADESNDFMLNDREGCEEKILRLSQKSRAAGIHMILATQRPDVKVFTGNIKANFLCRLALKASSNKDSIVMLDIGGAETLLGRGDMLYRSPESAGLTRMQGPYVSDAEVANIVDYICQENPSIDGYTLDDAIDDEAKKKSSAQSSGGVADDRCLEALVYWITRNQGMASKASIQSALSIGTNRANKIFAYLEDRGCIPPLGPGDNPAKARKLTITFEEAMEMFPDQADNL